MFNLVGEQIVSIWWKEVRISAFQIAKLLLRPMRFNKGNQSEDREEAVHFTFYAKFLFV